MWRMTAKKENFEDRGTWTMRECIFEPCPKCARGDLRYPERWSQGGNCPDCKTHLPGEMLFKKQWSRKHYHIGLEHSAIGKILLCTE